MRRGGRSLGLGAALLGFTITAGVVRAIEEEPSAALLAAQALAACEQGRSATDRADRKRAFTEGLALATRAVALDDESASAHFATFCNRGELLRLDGEKLTSVLALRTVLNDLDRTLALEPGHTKAMASKGILLLRLPRMLGGDAQVGEEMLRDVIARDPTAFSSRLALAERCRQRGEIDEARVYAGRALEIASEQGRVDRVEEAAATLAKIDSAR